MFYIFEYMTKFNEEASETLTNQGIHLIIKSIQMLLIEIKFIEVAVVKLQKILFVFLKNNNFKKILNKIVYFRKSLSN